MPSTAGMALRRQRASPSPPLRTIIASSIVGRLICLPSCPPARTAQAVGSGNLAAAHEVQKQREKPLISLSTLMKTVLFF
jgi:hypothetical protein